MPNLAARPLPVHQHLKPRRSRVKTGCRPCRVRRKKCDEGKPVCSGCKKNHLICSSPEVHASDPGSRASQTTSDKEPQSNSVQSTEPMPRTSANMDLDSDFESLSEYGQETFQKGLWAPLRQLNSHDVLGSRASRHPATRTLLDFYLHETSGLLSIKRGPRNPFITCVIPLALSHSMIMDSVLALGGAHLCHRTDEADINCVSSTHYALTVRQLKYELTRVSQGVESDPTRLLLTILLLSTAESISGNSQGAIFHHLRASSHFIPSLLALDPNHGDPEIRAFLLETYAYMVSVANITVNTPSPYPTFILDPFIAGLERFQDCKASGMMFGFARNLLTLLPSICELGYNRILEENTGTNSFENVTYYKSLQSKIESWKEPLVNANSESDVKDLATASKIYKEAILIFLHTAFYGSKVEDPDLLNLIDASVSRALPFSIDNDSPVLSVMLWSCMVIGSCLRGAAARQYLRSRMLETHFNMTIVLRSIQILDWLWADNAVDAYGPYGLGVVMRKHGVMHSMS